MASSYILAAIRNFLRNSFSTSVNILGLAAAFCCTIFIVLYAIDEYRFDRFHENAAHIYRFNTQFGPQSERVPLGPYLLDSHLDEKVPGLLKTSRLRPGEAMFLWLTDRYQVHLDQDIMLVDSCFFSFFSFPLLQGQPDQVLQDPHSMVIASSLATRLYGEEDPVGKVLYLQGEHPVHITGVMEDLPRQSHFGAAAVVNVETIRRFAPDFIFNHYGSFGFYYYLLLDPLADPLLVAESINQTFSEIAPEIGADATFHLQPLLDIRLKSQRIAWDIDNHGNYSLLLGLIAIAAIILLLASVNYINLYTAQSVRRKKEMGIRKVMGATRKHIFWQSMTESLIIILIAFVLAIGLAEIFSPLIRDLSGKPLNMGLLLTPPAIPWIVLVLGAVTFLSGFYPGMVLGRFRPADILRGSIPGNAAGRFWGQLMNLRVRQALIVFQFACTTALIVMSLSVNRQIRYMLSADRGYESQELFLIHNPYDEQQESRFERIKLSLEQFPSVGVVSAGMNVPTERIGNFTGIMLPEDDHEVQSGQVNVHADYFRAIGARLIAGRFFSEEYGNEHRNIVVNRTAARALGFERPEDIVGNEVITALFEGRLRVIGVIEDIHYYSLHELITPMIFTTGSQQPAYGNILVKSTPGQMDRAIRAAAELWGDEHSSVPFNHSLIETRSRALYQGEEQTRQLLNLFMGLALIISLMGLFALSSFVMVFRIKEIAVRKVLGARQRQVLLMFGREFSLLVIISSAIAWPLAWLVAGHWLDNFAYRQDIHYGYFILATCISLLAAWFTITYHGIKTSKTNAAAALKYE